ncbi:MAG: PLDc N-terminal domain-containing protein [Peptoniphilaceae bacterium]|nr:PLDc N-terminal domain-containing protein [Peptoniphilaceae bacterium]MDY5832972.1 PLDc N-terminal domain-containing protein [Candidatus Onthovivens sp.]
MKEFVELIKPMLPLYLFIGALYLIFLIYCIRDILKSNTMSRKSKVIWIIFVIVIQVIGPIIYLVIGKKETNEKLT